MVRSFLRASWFIWENQTFCCSPILLLFIHLFISLLVSDCCWITLIHLLSKSSSLAYVSVPVSFWDHRTRTSFPWIPSQINWGQFPLFPWSEKLLGICSPVPSLQFTNSSHGSFVSGRPNLPLTLSFAPLLPTCELWFPLMTMSWQSSLSWDHWRCFSPFSSIIPHFFCWGSHSPGSHKI